MDKSSYTSQCGESKPDDRYFEDAVRLAIEDWVAKQISVEEIPATIGFYTHHLAYEPSLRI